uniref:RING-type domain-containing protein n=1 Tax=Erpetoichthys calabaricus TaxID=27687 RepID=A0A8C4RCF0_ERPCA
MLYYRLDFGNLDINSLIDSESAIPGARSQLSYFKFEGEVLSSCGICLLTYKQGVQLRSLPCFHDFHMNCIDHWLLINSTCPMCRTPNNSDLGQKFSQLCRSVMSDRKKSNYHCREAH